MGNVYKEGLNRKQQLLFPPSIDEYAGEENLVRAIDAYVGILDMAELGFTNAALGSAAGQPAYHPRLFLKYKIQGSVATYSCYSFFPIIAHPFVVYEDYIK